MIKYREHSSRAWDIQFEKMVIDPFILSKSLNKEDEGKWLYYLDWSDYEDGISRLCYRMGYSGMDDLDGVMIYEGDIIKSLIHNPAHYQVEFIEGGFCCTHPLVKNYPTDINHFGGKIKVVGNIFQNPELLGLKK